MANKMHRYWTRLSLGAVASAAVIAVGLAFTTGPAYADHNTDHVVQNLKGGLGALELRVWNCETGFGDTCPGNTGPAGPQGPQGEQGPAGNDGAPGTPGADGTDGAPGTPGADGTDGADGLAGNDGAPGTPGSDGADGEPGLAGMDGLSCWDTNGDNFMDPEEDINNDGAWDAADCRGNSGSGNTGSIVYRWNVFSTYSQANGWYAGNDAALFGGVAPQVWSDGNGRAWQMSSDKNVLRTLLTKRGYGGSNAVIASEEWQSFSSTNSHHAVALFRIRNNTLDPIVWDVDFYATAYTSWSEKASVTVNGLQSYEGPCNSCTASFVHMTSLSIPEDRTSTVIFAAGSSHPNTTRSLYLAFTGDSLTLPAGLEFIDDLDTATGGWEQ